MSLTRGISCRTRAWALWHPGNVVSVSGEALKPTRPARLAILTGAKEKIIAFCEHYYGAETDHSVDALFTSQSTTDSVLESWKYGSTVERGKRKKDIQFEEWKWTCMWLAELIVRNKQQLSTCASIGWLSALIFRHYLVLLSICSQFLACLQRQNVSSAGTAYFFIY